MSFAEYNDHDAPPYKIYSAFDMDAVSSPQTALMIANNETNSHDVIPASAMISTFTISPSTYFDQSSDKMSPDHQYSVVPDHQYSVVPGQNFLVLEQPAEKYFLPDQDVSHASTQCLLEMSGSDESEGPEAETGVHYDTDFQSNQPCSEDMTRKERRREQNRRAAQRCRARRKMREAVVVREMEKEMATMRFLETEVQRLTSQKLQLELTLMQHGVSASRTDYSFVRGEDTAVSSPYYLPPLPEIFPSVSAADAH